MTMVSQESEKGLVAKDKTTLYRVLTYLQFRKQSSGLKDYVTLGNIFNKFGQVDEVNIFDQHLIEFDQLLS